MSIKPAADEDDDDGPSGGGGGRVGFMGFDDDK